MFGLEKILDKKTYIPTSIERCVADIIILGFSPLEGD